MLFSIIEELDDFEVVVKLKGCLNATVGMDDRVELIVNLFKNTLLWLKDVRLVSCNFSFK